MKKIQLLCIYLLLAVSTVWADDVTDAGAAFDRKDYATALNMYKNAALNGNKYAQLQVGLIYHDGLGVIQDYAEAMRWYRLAAKGISSGRIKFPGLPEAHNNIGSMYQKGEGVKKDFAESVVWYRSAAFQGLPEAHYNLGFMYANGLGVTQDYVRAHMWWNFASINGDAESVKSRNQISTKMSHQQIEKAQQMARDCRKEKVFICN